MQVRVQNLITRTAGCLMLAGVLLLPTPGRSAESVFKVCADPNNPPFSERNGQGFENRIAELLAGERGQKVEYTWFPQRMGFIRNTLKFPLPQSQGGGYKCDVVMGVPTGYELTATTQAYYRSSYALVYRKNQGLDTLTTPTDLDTLPSELKQKLRIAMFDASPGTSWLIRHGWVQQGIPYQSMTGDASINTAQILEKDFTENRIDMAIIWGPIAGYLQSRQPDQLALLPVSSEPGLQMDFSISMGVRIPDKSRKEELDQLITHNTDKIRKILQDYHLPLLE
ncbi:MAG: quinoprotein dehydrogenase-associated putative ABC transporter substrate-binding protein [Methylococcaceae bacterium]